MVDVAMRGCNALSADLSSQAPELAMGELWEPATEQAFGASKGTKDAGRRQLHGSERKVVACRSLWLTKRLSRTDPSCVTDGNPIAAAHNLVGVGGRGSTRNAAITCDATRSVRRKVSLHALAPRRPLYPPSTQFLPLHRLHFSTALLASLCLSPCTPSELSPALLLGQLSVSPQKPPARRARCSDKLPHSSQHHGRRLLPDSQRLSTSRRSGDKRAMVWPEMHIASERR